MPKKSLLIIKRALNLLKFSILMAKIGKPINPRFIFLKNSRKIKKSKLLKHYNYAFIEELEFSPSNTPLFHHYRKNFKKRNYYSMFFLCRCSGSLRVEGGECEGDDGVYALETQQTVDYGVKELTEPWDSGDEDDDSVDQRAEMFIQRFYENMRIQRQESVL